MYLLSGNVVQIPPFSQGSLAKQTSVIMSQLRPVNPGRQDGNGIEFPKSPDCKV